MDTVTLPAAWLEDDGRIALKVSPRLRERVKSIPGARYHAPSETWRLSPGWLSAIAMRREFPDLQLHPDLNEWGYRMADELNKRIYYRDNYAYTYHDLYDFQNQGVGFLQAAKRCVLADDMGLGKTIQAITALSSLENLALPAIVVATNSMLYKWAEEFAKWAPKLEVRVVTGTAAKRRALLAPGADVYIIGWATVRLHTRLAPYGSIALTAAEKAPKELDALEPKAVIVDEAHRMVDPKAKQTRAVWNLQHRAKYVWSLTGTPITNSVENIWSILHGVAPDEFPSRTGFIDRYTYSGAGYFGGLEIYGLNPTYRDELFSVVDSLMLRRTKAQVLPSLPAKIYSRRFVELGTAQRKAYNDMHKHLLADLKGGLLIADNPLVRTTRLLQLASSMLEIEDDKVVRAIAPSAKMAALRDVLDEAPDESFVIFTQSRKLADLVYSELGPDAALVTGAVTGVDRAAAVEQFQSGRSQYIVCTLGAGGEGITLTAASKAIFLQRSFSMVQDRQAEDRIHRIGQSAQSVEIIDIVALDTIEHRVFEAVYDKGLHFESIVRDSLKSLL